MKVLWICGLPREVQREAFGGKNLGANAEWSWILGHLPPPPEVELHIACGHHRHAEPKTISYQGAFIHLVPVKVRARLFSLFQFDWFFFRTLAEEIEPDVVHGWGTEDAHALTAIKLCPDRHVVEIQGNLNEYERHAHMPWLTRLAAWSERMALARARHVVAENEYSLRSVLPMIRTKSAHVIEHPVRSGFLENPPSAGEARQILFVGTIEERKGIWDALEAFRKGAPQDWKLAIIGNGRGKLTAKMRRLISENGLELRVVHYPQLTTLEMISVMQSSSVFLLPTRIDTGPTALKEALSMGLWPICYDNSGPAHYIRRFQCGNLAEDLNSAALTETLSQAILAQEWKRDLNRAKIETVIRPHFDRANIWPELAKLYSEASGQRVRTGA